MFDLGSLQIWIDVIIILIPVLVAVALIWKLVIPRHPKLGIGLISGIGLIGGYLIQRKLKKAFAVEEKLAEFNENFAQFKEVQKRRQEAVSANQQVINALQKKRRMLERNAEKYQTELRLIDAELEDRKKLNEQLLKDAASFMSGAEKRSAERLKLIGGLPPNEESEVPAGSNAPIEIDGYRLLEE